jgi:hypothetical protein
LPVQSQADYLIDRLEILHPGTSPLHSDLRGYWRQDVAKLALKLDSANLPLSRRDREDLQYLANENNEWIPDTNRLFQRSKRPFLKVFYTTPANLYEVNTRYFNILF